MSRPLRLAVVGSLLTGALLAGCSGDTPDDPAPSGSGGSGGPASTSGGTAGASSGPSTPALQDRSEEVVGGATAATAIASTTGKAGSTYAGATFTIYGLTRTDASTLLTWRVTAGKAAASAGDANVRAWEKYPIMVTGGKEYSVLTFDKLVDGYAALSDPTLKMGAGTQAAPQYALYPPLPAGTTTVTLKGTWFADVAVPVTDVTG